jgi:hypothetical protein
VKIAFSSIFDTIQEARQKFDFTTALLPTKDELRDILVYKSGSAGAKDWSFPEDQKMNWDNPLTAITKYNDYEFNFIFKEGQTSDAPFTSKSTQIVKINPPDSVVRKIIVHYAQHCYVIGFKLFNADDTCVL